MGLGSCYNAAFSRPINFVANAINLEVTDAVPEIAEAILAGGKSLLFRLVVA
jgi:hypothetical protein